jgi:hypothetical protein
MEEDNNSNDSSSINRASADYYAIFTPSLLHDALITSIIRWYIYTNDNNNDDDNDYETIAASTSIAPTSIAPTSIAETSIAETSIAVTSIQAVSNVSKRLEPFYHTTDGVLVAVDISQFTKLSVTLEIEEMEYVINEIFGTLASIVYCFGGDIIKFAGDAFYGFWKFDKNDENHKAHKYLQVHASS